MDTQDSFRETVTNLINMLYMKADMIDWTLPDSLCVLHSFDVNNVGVCIILRLEKNKIIVELDYQNIAAYDYIEIGNGNFGPLTMDVKATLLFDRAISAARGKNGLKHLDTIKTITRQLEELNK